MKRLITYGVYIWHRNKEQIWEPTLLIECRANKGLAIKKFNSLASEITADDDTFLAVAKRDNFNLENYSMYITNRYGK